jgi:hypothetical protein
MQNGYSRYSQRSERNRLSIRLRTQLGPPDENGGQRDGGVEVSWQSIGNRMDFGRATASAASDCLSLGPPFPPALHLCALLVVLSMDCTSALSNRTNWLNMLCQMPAFDQRLNRL